MFLEIAIIQIKSGSEEKFERAAEKAVEIFRNAKGCAAMELRRSVETPLRYLLFVHWRTLEDHIVGFRNDPAGLQAWRSLVGEFYDGSPTFEHSVRAVAGFHAA